ncbi:Thiamin pyrophosphokinase 1 [Strongyloides ratti]|uniref:Thiamin pyrophosphokinase 1 n=1 Tax=Strongyloides ratti TaxID=34506 RepID=A0A090LBF4_STRRB|nr:Thiamin pyrophosphokinase 1 [Strongyloides ratti]CEF67101.1 Thiamin pyrophosphokinase 1 [Strongyloides ratti]
MSKSILHILPWINNSDQTVAIWLNSPVNEKNDIKLYSHIWNNAILRYCTDGSSNLVAKYQDEYNLKDPNYIVGDFDSITEYSRNYFKNKSQFIHAPNQDFTDFSKVLHQITLNSLFPNINKILALGGLSGRFDHSLASLNSILMFQKSISEEQIKTYLIDENNLITITSASETIVKITPNMDNLTGKCGYIPIMQEKTVVTTEGYKWNLENEEIFFGGLISTSNEIEKDVLLIKSNQPIILYFEIKK